MNIDATTQVITTSTTNANTIKTNEKNDSANFAEELSNLKTSDTKEDKNTESSPKGSPNENTLENQNETIVDFNDENQNSENIKCNSDKIENDTLNNEKQSQEKITDILNGLQGVVEEMNKTKQQVNQIEDTDYNTMEKESILSDNKNNEVENIPSQSKNIDINDEKYDKTEILHKPKNDVNDSNDKQENTLFESKDDVTLSKNNEEEDNILINNDMNIQEPQDKFTPQMNAQMNFNSSGQPFSAFVQQSENNELGASEKDLAEENAILSTMVENIAIANQNIVVSPKKESNADVKPKTTIKTETLKVSEIIEESIEEPKQKTVTNEQGIKKVDVKTNITVETVVKYDTVVMNSDDVEFFTQLVENGSVDLNTQAQNAVKSSQVSKTLADLIAKSMNENQPIRIDFDNDISVIIKVSKDGKVSADFLPSSQVAEAYLKDNLPILKQRFDENNIDYDELNQRKQQRQDDRDNRKKGRKDE